MKKKIFFLVVISSFLGMFSLINIKQEMFCGDLCLTDIEALASEGKTYLIVECYLGVEIVEDGRFLQVSCNEGEGLLPDEMNECADVYTDLAYTSFRQNCYRIVYEPPF